MIDELKDPLSDPGNPKEVDFCAVNSASIMISGGVEYTPCDKSDEANSCGMELYYKREYLQATGSFQDRGALNALLWLCERKKKKGVITCSGGNFGLALSYFGKLQNIPVTVVMPKKHSQMKADRCRRNCARLIIFGNNLSEALVLAYEISARDGIQFISSYDYPDVIAANGTVAMEILDQVEQPDAIIVPVRSGSLLAGICVAVKQLSPTTQVIGVETKKSAKFSAALTSDCPFFINQETAIIQNSNIPLVGYNAYRTAKQLVDKVLVIEDCYVSLAVMRLLDKEKAVVEGAGALPMAAALAAQLPEFQGKKVVMVLSAGNIDIPELLRCLNCGFAAAGRLVRFKCSLCDQPQAIEKLCKSLKDLGVLVKKVLHDRAFADDIYKVNVTVTCVTPTSNYFPELKKQLSKKYADIRFPDYPNSGD